MFFFTPEAVQVTVLRTVRCDGKLDDAMVEAEADDGDSVIVLLINRYVNIARDGDSGGVCQSL